MTVLRGYSPRRRALIPAPVLPAPLESLSDEAVLATAEEIMAWVEASGHKIGWGIANRIAQQFTRRAIAAHLPQEGQP